MHIGHWNGEHHVEKMLGIEKTYEFLATDQPSVDFVEMEYVMAWQLAYTVALGELGEANCAFKL